LTGVNLGFHALVGLERGHALRFRFDYTQANGKEFAYSVSRTMNTYPFISEGISGFGTFKPWPYPRLSGTSTVGIRASRKVRARHKDP
jgi:hypothetical protein